MPHYLLSWTNPSERLFDVTIRFTAPADTPRLLLPAWRPGRYLIQNYAANVREWTAGEEARVWKDGLSSWRVDARAGEEVTFRYRYYAGVLDAGSSFLDEDEAYFNGSNLFMLVEGLRSEEHLLTIAAPADWYVETQLPPHPALRATLSPQAGRGETAPGTPSPRLRGEGGRRPDEGRDTVFRARDFDHLIDSPVIAAPMMTRHSFVESGACIHLVFRGDEGLDTEQFVEPVRAVARYQAELFGGVPFRDYRFLYHVRDRWHGVEHEDSSSIILSRKALLGCRPGDDGYDHFLSITAHELFHAWMVKRILPAVFSPYDYWNATPTRLLWVMEGVTSYYGERSLVRSGLWTVERYLRHLENEIRILESLPARHHLSLSQASFDGWLSDPAQMHDHPNAFFSFYNKGELVAALLDLTLRRATGGERGLDDVVRLLWEEYGHTGRGMEEDAMERAVGRVADVGDFFARYVDGTEPLPYAELLGAAGVAFASTPGAAPVLGARLSSGDGSLFVESVIRGGAAMEAGLLPHDELLAIGDTRVADEASLAAALRGLKSGESAEVLIARAGVVRRLSLTAKPDPRPRIELRVTGPSDLRKAWLRREE